jgi:hypothetical protein
MKTTSFVLAFSVLAILLKAIQRGPMTDSTMVATQQEQIQRLTQHVIH